MYSKYYYDFIIFRRTQLIEVKKNMKLMRNLINFYTIN